MEKTHSQSVVRVYVRPACPVGGLQRLWRTPGARVVLRDVYWERGSGTDGAGEGGGVLYRIAGNFFGGVPNFVVFGVQFQSRN